MKLEKLKYVILLLCVVYTSSCSDDFLTKVNPNEEANDNFWQNLNDTEKGLNAAYATLRSYFLTTIVENSCKADMGWPGYGRPAPTANSPGRYYYLLTYYNTDVAIQKKWETYYQGIFRANQVIEALERIKPTVTDQNAWTVQMAEARFLRGLFHFYLHSDFNNGRIIIRDFVPRTVDDFNKDVSSSEEVIEFFRKDLKFAFENLPYKVTLLGKATKGMAATILGTSYLYQNEIDLAKSLFDDIINNSSYGYALEDDMTKWFTTKGEFNKESIFEVAYSSTLRPDLNVWNELSMSNRLAFYSNNIVGFYVPAWLAYEYRFEKMDTTDVRNFYTNASDPTKKLRRPVSLRASAMVTLVNDTLSNYYLTASTAENAKFGATSWGISWYKKYTNHDILQKESELPRGQLASGKNIVLNRLAEVYLMNAECLIKKGKVDSAVILINKIRKRWGLQLIGPDRGDGKMYDNINYDQTSLMDRLMYVEKPLELSAEGNASRWNDLRRWGVIKSNYQRLANEMFYLVDFKFTTVAGVKTNKQWVSITKDNTMQQNAVVVDYEYDQTNDNYVPEVHDYLPIPLSEYTTNASLTK